MKPCHRTLHYSSSWLGGLDFYTGLEQGKDLTAGLGKAERCSLGLLTPQPGPPHSRAAARWTSAQLTLAYNKAALCRGRSVHFGFRGKGSLLIRHVPSSSLKYQEKDQQSETSAERNRRHFV